jgi:hypothetical protein
MRGQVMDVQARTLQEKGRQMRGPNSGTAGVPVKGRAQGKWKEGSGSGCSGRSVQIPHWTKKENLGCIISGGRHGRFQTGVQNCDIN